MATLGKPSFAHQSATKPKTTPLVTHKAFSAPRSSSSCVHSQTVHVFSVTHMYIHRCRKEIILRSNSPWGFCPFHHPDSPKGQVMRVSGELLPCMTRGSSHRPLRLLTGGPSMPRELSRVVNRRGICLHAVQHGGVSCIGFTSAQCWHRHSLLCLNYTSLFTHALAVPKIVVFYILTSF